MYGDEDDGDGDGDDDDDDGDDDGDGICMILEGNVDLQASLMLGFLSTSFSLFLF